MSTGATHRCLPGGTPRAFTILPSTRLGWWAVALAATFLPLVLAAGVVPRSAAAGLLAAVAGGSCAVVAITRRGERALAVYAAVVPLTIAAAFLLAELLLAELVGGV